MVNSENCVQSHAHNKIEFDNILIYDIGGELSKEKRRLVLREGRVVLWASCSAFYINP